MRAIDEIIVHCSATPPDWLADEPLSTKVQRIRSWHVNGNGWSDIGYHFVIDRDGSVATGRNIQRSGAHVAGHNARSVGVCLLGGKGSSRDDRITDHYTKKQITALRDLIHDLRRQHPSLTKLSGHNEYSSKACPGFKVKPWWHSIEADGAESPSTQGGGLIAAIVSLLSAIARLFNGPKK